MLVDFEDESLRRLYEDKNFRVPRIGPELTKAYRRRLQVVVAAVDERDLRNMRSNRFEKLSGDRDGSWSLRLNDQWRLIVRLEDRAEGRFVVVTEIVDYH